MTTAIDAAPGIVAAGSTDQADVVLLDACGYEWDETVAAVVTDRRTAHLPRIVLSVLEADGAPEGTFAAEIAEREAAVADGRTCVLRCAPFGEELAWSAPYETAGALYTAWRPEGAAWLGVADMVGLVAEIVRTDRHWGSAYDVTGPEVVSMERACALFEDLHGRSLPYVHLPADAHRAAMEQVGFDARHSRQRSDYMDWTTSGPGRVVSPLVEQALGRPAQDLGSYLLPAARSALALA